MSKDKFIPILRFPEFKNKGEWEEKSLDKVVNDFIVPMRDKPKSLDGETPWCRIEDFDGMYLSGSKSKQGVSLETIKEMNLKVYPINTLLVSCSADLGRCAITLKPLVTNQTFIGLVPNEEKVNSIYLYYVMTNSRNELNSRSSGTTISYLSRQQFEKFEIPIPKPTEQQKIAACLSSLDEVITAESQKLEVLKDHKKGLLQNLLPQAGETVPKFRFKEFEDSCDWQETTLTQVADYENGKAHEQDIADDGEFIVVNSKFISQDGEVKKFTNTAFLPATKGDVLMVLSDIPNGKAIAKCFLVEEDNRYTVNQRICRITPRNLNSKILYYLLNRKPYFLAFDDGVKQTNLRKEDVLNCPLLIPEDPKEQEKIADTLSSVDDLIKAQIEKLEALQLHKKGLLQGLFPNVNDGDNGKI